MEMNEFYMELGQNIRRFRKMCNMTQKQLAHSVHKSLACVSKYEKGNVAIDIYTIQQIADQLGVSVGQLIPETRLASQQPAATSLQLHPMFRHSPLYLCWYRGGKQSLVRHVIEVDSSTGQVACYMEVDNYSDYKSCRYMMFGKLSSNGPNTYLYATNPILTEDFIFACFSSVDLFESHMVGFLSCLNRSYHITSTKCFISHTPIHSSEEVLRAILVTKKELAEFKRSNFFTFGTHQQQF